MVTVQDGTGEPVGVPRVGAVPRPRAALLPAGLMSTGRRARGRRVAEPSTRSSTLPLESRQVVLPPGDPLPRSAPTAPTAPTAPLRSVASVPVAPSTGASAAPSTEASVGETPVGPGPGPTGAWARALEALRSVLLRRLQFDDAAWWCALAGFGSGFAAVATLMPQLLPLAAGLLLVLVALVLTPTVYLLMDAAVVGAVVALAVLLAGRSVEWLPTAELVMVGAIVIGCARHRERAGVTDKIGAVGEADAVLVDLREQVLARTAIPPLPAGWRLEAELRQARQDRFGGDFVVATTPTSGQLDVVLVDVSGKGRQAGGRALLLRGAFAALLDSVSAHDFLRLANGHVLRHGDAEGFATAVHVSVDLVSGHFRLSAAGHLPAAQYHAGSGRWHLTELEPGLPLGILADERYAVASGYLERGDALLLYTDGLVEGGGRDVGRGIDRLLGRAESELLAGPRGSAARIVEAVGGTDDDRGLVVLLRT